jgi:enoyl-CoA hydratase
MTAAFWAELPRLLDGLDASGQTWALLLGSTGRHFTARMDLSLFGDGLLQASTARPRGQFQH